MLSVVIPFRAKAMSDDWAHQKWLLERTLKSLLASPATARIFIVRHEFPSIASDPRIELIDAHVDLPARNNDDMCVDKVLKNSIGLRLAVKTGGDHVMITDADDLISRRALDLSDSFPRGAGWYTSQTYGYAYGARFMKRNTLRYPTASSTIIVRPDLLEFAEPPFSGRWFDLIADEPDYMRLLSARKHFVCTLAAVGHMKYLSLLCGVGPSASLTSFPIVAQTVINHSNSLSHVPLLSVRPEHGTSKWRSYLGRLKRRLRELPKLLPLTDSLRRDFAIPLSSDVPAAYRRLGTVFER
jgi:hypothetical protein